MRLLRIIILSFFLLPFNIFGQEALSSLDSNWLKLTGPMMLRYETINSLIKRLNNIKAIPAKELKTLAALSDSVYARAQNKNWRDSAMIDSFNHQNNQLMISLSRVYVFLESSKKAANDDNILSMKYRIEACENRITFARREYNESCIAFNKMDLKFGDLNEQPPKVEF